MCMPMESPTIKTKGILITSKSFFLLLCSLSSPLFLLNPQPTLLTTTDLLSLILDWPSSFINLYESYKYTFLGNLASFTQHSYFETYLYAVNFISLYILKNWFILSKLLNLLA